MAVITNANDVELILEQAGTKRGTSVSMGRIVVDDFSIARSEGNELVGGVGFRNPGGITYGDIEYTWSFTLMGQDLDVFDMVANEEGESQAFSFTARKTDDDGNIEFEFALDTCVANDDEFSASSGDPTEYSVDGIAVSMERIVNP